MAAYELMEGTCLNRLTEGARIWLAKDHSKRLGRS
jgi:hypothetical protein